MADSLKIPGKASSTATRESLKTGPADKPNWGGGMGTKHVTSTTMPLKHNPIPVANLENKPSHGTEQVTSTKMNLSRKTGYPYQPTSKTTPETDL